MTVTNKDFKELLSSAPFLLQMFPSAAVNSAHLQLWGTRRHMLSPDRNSLSQKTDLLKSRDAPAANIVRKKRRFKRTHVGQKSTSLGESRCSDPALSGSHL